MLQDFTPKLFIGFLNNIYPCHLDWHDNSFEVYEEAKLNILRNAQIQIVHGNFLEIPEIKKIHGEKTTFGTKGDFHVQDENIFFKEELFLEKKESLLQGRHNLENICGVLEICSQVISDREKLQKVAKEVLRVFS